MKDVEKRGYKYYDLATRKVYISQDVKFSNFESWYKTKVVEMEDNADHPYTFGVKHNKHVHEKEFVQDMPSLDDMLKSTRSKSLV